MKGQGRRNRYFQMNYKGWKLVPQKFRNFFEILCDGIYFPKIKFGTVLEMNLGLEILVGM